MKPKSASPQLDYSERIGEDLVQLARLAVAGQSQEALLFVQRLGRRYRSTSPLLADKLTVILRLASSPSSPLRQAVTPLPVDGDSRFELADVQWPTGEEGGPILNPSTIGILVQLIQERQSRDKLATAGLFPARTALFVGPPGVGKSMAAKWIAGELGLPLLTLDLSAVMSSLLGRTGANLKAIFDYAKQQECILFLDEIDAIAKRRDDPSDIGELKRLVTVLLQQIEQWPVNGGLLVAATNHPELLDRAIWRRFDQVVTFELPDDDQRRLAVHRYSGEPLDSTLVELVMAATNGKSFSDLATIVARGQRAAVLNGVSLEVSLADQMVDEVRRLEAGARRLLARRLALTTTLSQRQVSELTGVSRDTIRKATGAGRGA